MKPKIVAEIGINHSGNLENAIALIDMAKDCGADYVKFQKRTVDVVYSPEDLDKPRESPWGTTQRQQKHGIELTRESYHVINDYCDLTGIPWFGSAWDMESLQFLECYSPPLHKIASPMLTNLEFVEAVAKLRRLTLVSTGMSTVEDLDKAVNILKYHDCPFVLMHCTSIYPCPEEKTNILTLKWLKHRYPCVPLGYSGHEVGLLPSILAVAMGAEWIERHITLDRASYGSDQSASLEKRGLELLVKYAHGVKTCLGEEDIKQFYAEERANAGKLRYWEVKRG
jgi:N-acetylneuraminate synthase